MTKKGDHSKLLETLRLYREWSSKWEWTPKECKRIAKAFSMRDYCEFCGLDNNPLNHLQRHHPDYRYPEIFITTCIWCHQWIHSNH